MLITRKIGKVVLGGATPAQLMMACVLGGMIGFMPGFAQAAGAIALLTVLLVLLNANLVLAGVTGLVAKAVSVPLLPVSFMVGRALLDGPPQPLFQWAINAPVLALFGFEYYVTTGGLVVGAGIGAIAGIVVIKGVQAFRRRMAAIEEGSELYRNWANKGWVKAVRWVLFGKAPKQGYKAALEAHGKVIRPLGLVAAGGLVVVIVLVNLLFADEIVTMALQRGLERANGATVDMERAELNLRQGRLSVEGLAMADPNALDRNLFQAGRLTAQVSTADLLRKRLTLDQLVFNDASTGSERRFPGRLVGDRPRPSAEPEPEADEKRIEDYLEDWDRLKHRLTQVREWIERLSGSETRPSAPPAPDVPEDVRPPLRDRLDERIATSGYAHVAATHLIEGRPTFTVRYVEAEKVRAVQLDGELLDIRGYNLSTHPHLLDESPRLTVRSSETDTLLADLDLGGASRSGGDSLVQFHYKGLAVNRLTEAVRFAGQSPIRDGTIDMALEGRLGAGSGAGAGPMLDLPLHMTLHDTTLRVGGREQGIDRLPLSLGLRGPIDNPAVRLDERQVAQALAEAGATQLAREALRDHAGIDLDDLQGLEDIGGAGDVGGLGDGVRRLEGVLGRQRGDAEADERDEGDGGDDDDGDDAGPTGIDRVRGLFDRINGD